MTTPVPRASGRSSNTNTSTGTPSPPSTSSETIARYINFYDHQRRCAKAGNLSPIRYELTLAFTQQAA